MSYVTPLYEHAYYVGNFVGGVLYGVELTMYFITFRALVKNPSPRSGLGNRFFLVYTTILLGLLTAEIATAAYWSQMMWITGRSYDSTGKLGLKPWIRENTVVWYHRLLNPLAFALMVFMGDGLLIWRLYVVYGHKWQVIVLPCLVYVAVFVLALLEFLSRVVDGFMVQHNSIVGVPYYALTIGMNLITLLICIRLWLMSRQSKELFGPDSAKTYTSVAAILVESALPYSVSGIAFLVAYARGNELYVLFQQIWAVLACLAPQFIILRVATGKACNGNGSRVGSSLVFQHTEHLGTGMTGSTHSGEGDTLDSTPPAEQGEKNESAV